jgi:hypothetical protein
MRIGIGFEDSLHLGDVAFAARLLDEEIEDLRLEA